jgi:hypothetical protein
LITFLLVSGVFFLVTFLGKLPRTQRYYAEGKLAGQ